jgi:predicted CXXCH cytochrome family protein
MGRSFYRPEQIAAGSYYHQASDEYLTVAERAGRFYMRRHQLASDGREINALEKSIDFVLGSGNHARTFLHRNSRSELVELPLAWYAEDGGTWAMNPGYDRPDHPDFQRKLDRECFFCHNAYPAFDSPSGQARDAIALPGAVTLGIDCQRCHGAGDAHVRLAQSGKPAADVRRAIVNPARLDPRRRLEVCLQCHLESSARALPYMLRRYGRGYFSYRPGERLENYMLHFERAGGPGNGFEIAHAGYRFLRSACYRRSDGALDCTTCHNPHEEQHGAEAIERYQKVCRNCHATLSNGHPAATACLDCHMPKRRTDDVVHAVMTDHGIPGRKPSGDLLAPKPEARETETIYRGKVVLFYPPKPAAGADTELYLSLAQVADGSDLEGGIPRLCEAITRNSAARAEFYSELANACGKSGRREESFRYYEEALRRQPDMTDARVNYALALQQAGRAADAIEVLQRAPQSPEVLNELGFVLFHAGRVDEAVARFRRAMEGDPDLPEIYVNMAAALARKRDHAGAIDALRTAVVLRPNLVAVRNNLASLLNARGDFAEAREHFRFAIRIDPNYVAVRYNYGLALVQHGEFDEAEAELREALRLDPRSAEALTSLGMALAGKGRWEEAIAQYLRALEIKPDLEAAKVNLRLARERVR